MKFAHLGLSYISIVEKHAFTATLTASQGVFNSNSNMVCDRTVSGAGQDKKVDETYSCIMLTLYDKACVLTVYVQLSTVIAENLIFNRLLSPQ